MTDKANETHRENVLKIDATLSVTLARRRIPLDRVLGLAPGAMLTFPKCYADPVDLDASGQKIAHGEIVRVGNKFGIRILQLLEPSSRRSGEPDSARFA